MKNAKYKLASINFGEPENPARVLIDSFVQNHGKAKLSELVRRAICVMLSKGPEFNDFEILNLKFRRQEIINTIQALAQEKINIEDRLKELGDHEAADIVLKKTRVVHA